MKRRLWCNAVSHCATVAYVCVSRIGVAAELTYQPGRGSANKIAKLMFLFDIVFDSPFRMSPGRVPSATIAISRNSGIPGFLTPSRDASILVEVRFRMFDPDYWRPGRRRSHQGHSTVYSTSRSRDELKYVSDRHTTPATALCLGAHRATARSRRRDLAAMSFRSRRLGGTLPLRALRMRLPVGRAMLDSLLLFYGPGEGRVGTPERRCGAGVRRGCCQAGSGRSAKTGVRPLPPPGRPASRRAVARRCHSKRRRAGEEQGTFLAAGLLAECAALPRFDATVAGCDCELAG